MWPALRLLNKLGRTSLKQKDGSNSRFWPEMLSGPGETLPQFSNKNSAFWQQKSALDCWLKIGFKDGFVAYIFQIKPCYVQKIVPLILNVGGLFIF